MTKYRSLTSIGLMAAVVGCGTAAPVIQSAAGKIAPAVDAPTAAEMTAAYSSGSLTPAIRMSLVDSYVASIDARVPIAIPLLGELTRVETPLGPDALIDVTDEQWSRMESFYDGSQLVRVRLLPIEPATDTEEFYFNSGKLVMVRYFKNGANLVDPPDETGERFYFGQEGLLSWVMPDGTTMASSHPDYDYWSEQLLKEADRLMRGNTR